MCPSLLDSLLSKVLHKPFLFSACICYFRYISVCALKQRKHILYLDKVFPSALNWSSIFRECVYCRSSVFIGKTNNMPAEGLCKGAIAVLLLRNIGLLFLKMQHIHRHFSRPRLITKLKNLSILPIQFAEQDLCI